MYNRRTWLNKDNSPSTGNVVAFEGEVQWKGEKIPSAFLSISDCNVSARLHKTDEDTMQDFIDKMKILKNEIDLFIQHLVRINGNGTKNSNTNSNANEFLLAIEYLKSRAVKSDKVSKQLLTQFMAVIPVSEVESVLKIALSGDFVSFYNEYNKQRTDETDQG